jgi:hypothetical protein
MAAAKKPKKVPPAEVKPVAKKTLTDADLHRIRMQAKRMVADLFARPLLRGQVMDDTLRDKVRSDENTIALKRYDYSLKSLREKYRDEPIPNKLVATALFLTEEELESEYERIVKKLQVLMVPKLADIDYQSMSRFKNFPSPHCHIQSLDTGCLPESFADREIEAGHRHPYQHRPRHPGCHPDPAQARQEEGAHLRPWARGVLPRRRLRHPQGCRNQSGGVPEVRGQGEEVRPHHDARAGPAGLRDDGQAALQGRPPS